MHKIESMKTGEKILENFSVIAMVNLGLLASHSSVLTTTLTVIQQFYCTNCGI